MDKHKKLHDFLHTHSVSFEKLITCYNFWSSLTDAERHQYIEGYENGEIKASGPYGIKEFKNKKRRRIAQ